ncbi:MAG TPA: hypothetical protein VFZ52_17505 [Chryseolinea sp.]
MTTFIELFKDPIVVCSLLTQLYKSWCNNHGAVMGSETVVIVDKLPVLKQYLTTETIQV